MNKKIKVGIVGVTGYVGAELVRAISSHPVFELEIIVSKSHVGKNFSDIYPSFKKIVDMKCSALDTQILADRCDVVITALPHGVSSVIVPQLLEKGLRVLDHSGDFRYKDVNEYEMAYKLKHPNPNFLKDAVYGLPELYRKKIASANLVANPGCYPTCSLLAIHPLINHSLIQNDSIIVSATSGLSGAGKSPGEGFSFCDSSENYKAYSVIGHRHTSEIEGIISFFASEKISISFTPHLAPLKRGMLCTVYANIKPEVNLSEIREAFVKDYEDEFFIRLLAEGVSPNTSDVEHTNFADISVFIDEHTRRVIVLSAIDNLGKGASLQAVQALNIMYGLDENEGLKIIGAFL